LDLRRFSRCTHRRLARGGDTIRNPAPEACATLGKLRWRGRIRVIDRLGA
jgi:hypothetical protein